MPYDTQGWARTCAALIALSIVGCDGQLLDGPTGPTGTPTRPDPMEDGATELPDGGLTGPPPACTGELAVGSSPLARMTRREVGSAVRDVLGIDGRVATTLAADGAEGVHGYIHNSAEVDALVARGYLAFAADVAARAPIETLTACRADGCVGEVIDHLGLRLVRRPIFEGERARYLELYAAGRSELGLDWNGGVRLVLEAMLQSPSFFLRGEEAIASVPGEVVPLGGHEIASRMAAFLWTSVPDPELLAAAARGDLDTAPGIEAQATRMLADERADRMYRDFHLQWLGVRGPEGDATPHTEDAALIRSMRDEANAFLSHVSREGRFEDLFGADYSFVDARLAEEVYGITAPTDVGMVRTELPAGRAGAFTLPLFLGAKIHEGDFSPIHLGVNTIRRFMCQELDNPPEGSLEINAGFSGTPREISSQRNELFCSTCHARIDPIGFLFYGFDHLGRPRTGPEVDTSGTIEGAGSLDGSYADIAEFAGALAADPAVRNCYLGHFVTYALGRAPGAGDQCSMDSVRARFESSGHRIDQIALAIVTSDSFRHRRATTATCD